MEHSNYNPGLYMVFYRDFGLFNEELLTKKELNEQLSWQKKGGFPADGFHICHYDYINEVFFNDNVEIDMDDIHKGIFKACILTQFKAQFFRRKLTELLEELEA